MNSTNAAKQPKSVNIEKIIKTETIKLLIAGVLFILVGSAMAFSAIAQLYYILPATTIGLISLIGYVVGLLAVLLMYSRPITLSLIRSSRDEYEYKVNNEAKVKAYNFLNFVVLMTILLASGGGQFTIGMLAIALGLSWIIIARGGGHLNA